MRRKLTNPADEMINTPVIDGAKARFLKRETAVRLATGYVEGFNSVTRELMDATAHGETNTEYLRSVASSENRDCFLLCLGPDSYAFATNQIQARLDLEGKRDSVYSLARDALVKAQQEFRDALTGFKKLVQPHQIV